MGEERIGTAREISVKLLMAVSWGGEILNPLSMIWIRNDDLEVLYCVRTKSLRIKAILQRDNTSKKKIARMSKIHGTHGKNKKECHMLSSWGQEDHLFQSPWLLYTASHP